MRLGGEVYRWKTAEEWALMHVEKGYGAALWPLGADASELDEQSFVQAARKHDLVIAEVGVWRNLFDPAPKAAEQNMAYAIQRLKLADRVQARCCVNISGSLSSVWDGPHPGNLTKETFDRIVRTTRAMLDEVKPRNTYYTLEPMPWMYPTDVATTKALIEAIDHPAFAVHVDMVNITNSPEKIYHTGEMVREFFGAFGPMIRSVHVKDLTIDNSLTVHMPEVVCGEGVFDLPALMTETAKLNDMPFIVEHLPDEATYDRAVSYLKGLSAQLKLPFDSAK